MTNQTSRASVHRIHPCRGWPSVFPLGKDISSPKSSDDANTPLRLPQSGSKSQVVLNLCTQALKACMKPVRKVLVSALTRAPFWSKRVAALPI